MKTRKAGWLYRAPGNIERIDACFSGAAFAPHRHDTYAIGITLQGVQSFDYRGSTRHSLPGQLVVLHPDELHDGRAGDEAPFRYRTACIAPALFQEMLGGQSLPFVEGGVSRDTRLQRPVCALLEDYHRPLGELEQQDLLFELATALQVVCGHIAPIKPVNRKAAMHARDCLDAGFERNVSLADLERETRRDRWQLSRDFRAMFGTTPYRYQIARRLDKARRLMLRGRGMADVAQSCGFSDQSHFGRAFKKTFGLTPQAWLRASTQDRSIREGSRAATLAG